MKRPAFQFYPADWRKDVELRSCSVAARGLWIDMLCIAHECEPYGNLTVNGHPMTAAQIAGQVGLTKQQCTVLLAELSENGVARTTTDGVIYSKRMVEDERLRMVRAAGGPSGAEHGSKGGAFGALGGRPRGDKKPPLHPPKEPPPSSSSSSSASAEEISATPPSSALPKVSKFPPGFEDFWAVYPKKVGKDKAIKAFAKRRFTDDQRRHVVAAVGEQRRWDQWTREAGQFIPNPATWLNEGRWQDEAPSSAADDRFAGAI